MAKLSNLQSWESFGLQEEKEKKEKKSNLIDEEDDDVTDNKSAKEDPKEELNKEFDEKQIEQIYSFLSSFAKDSDVRDVAHKLGVYLKNFSSTDTTKMEEFLKKKEDSK